MTEQFKKFYKEHQSEFEEEERLYQAECQLNETKIIMEGNRI